MIVEMEFTAMPIGGYATAGVEFWLRMEMKVKKPEQR